MSWSAVFHPPPNHEVVRTWGFGALSAGLWFGVASIVLTPTLYREPGVMSLAPPAAPLVLTMLSLGSLVAAFLFFAVVANARTLAVSIALCIVGLSIACMVGWSVEDHAAWFRSGNLGAKLGVVVIFLSAGALGRRGLRSIPAVRRAGCPEFDAHARRALVIGVVAAAALPLLPAWLPSPPLWTRFSQDMLAVGAGSAFFAVPLALAAHTVDRVRWALERQHDADFWPKA